MACKSGSLGSVISREEGQRGVLHDVDFILVPMSQRGELAELSEACVACR